MRNEQNVCFLEEEQRARSGSTKTGGVGDYRVEDRLQIVGRVSNRLQNSSDRGLLLVEFGHLLSQVRGGCFKSLVFELCHGPLVAWRPRPGLD